jgi:hypothetical protein
MIMNEMQLLTWVRGTGPQHCRGHLVLGVLWRLFEIYSLGRKKDLSARACAARRIRLADDFPATLPAEGMLKKAPVTYIAVPFFTSGWPSWCSCLRRTSS